MAFEWNLPDLGGLKAMVHDAAVAQRDAAARASAVWALVRHLGTAGLQAPPYNLDASGAQQVYDDVNRLSTPAAIYYGQAAQPDPFDFDDAFALLRAGS